MWKSSGDVGLMEINMHLALRSVVGAVVFATPHIALAGPFEDHQGIPLNCGKALNCVDTRRPILDYLIVIDHYDEAGVGEYVDVHGWVFTPSSFECLILELHGLGLIDRRVAKLVQRDAIEFIAILGNSATCLSEEAMKERRRFSWSGSWRKRVNTRMLGATSALPVASVDGNSPGEASRKPAFLSRMVCFPHSSNVLAAAGNCPVSTRMAPVHRREDARSRTRLPCGRRFPSVRSGVVSSDIP
jgi:hypothetical protein